MAAPRLLPLLLLACGLAAASPLAEQPAANASVDTVDSVPGSGRFHYLAVDGSALIIIDTKAHALYRRDLSTGKTELLAGAEGEPGYQDGPRSKARFQCPTAACALPGSGGLLVVADSQNACIRLVDRNGSVATLAGACGERPGFRDGAGREALFSTSIRSLVCLDNCSVLVADMSNGRLRRIDASGGGCPAPPGHPKRLSPLTLAAIWLLGGGAMLVAAVLAVNRWAADRAEAAQQCIRGLQAQRAVSSFEAEQEQALLDGRQANVAAAQRFHQRHPMGRQVEHFPPCGSTQMPAAAEAGLVQEEGAPDSPFARHPGPPLAFEPAGPFATAGPAAAAGEPGAAPASRKGPTPWSSLGYMDGTGLPAPGATSGSGGRPPSRRPSLSGGAGLPPRPPARAASLHDASTGTEPFADLNPLPPGSV